VVQQEQRRGAVRMEAVGRLAGGVAHDFNNLLTVIMGRCEVMLGRLPASDPIVRDVLLINDVAEKAASLTRQLLAFGRNQTLEPTVVDVNAVIFAMKAMLMSLIGENIRLQTALEPGVWRVLADQSQLEQVIVNLVVNAVDAMPEGGELTIQTSNVELLSDSKQFEFPVCPGRYVLMSVRDTGHGMDPETLSQVFEPFFTTKQDRGTGLGLSTVYGIVKQSNGYISAVSAPGKGTTFEIYLPGFEREAESKPASQPRPADGTETILLVEDAPLVRKLTRELLEARGYRVIEAPTAEVALQLCKAFVGQLHLLLSDIVMPRMSGRELAIEVVHQRPGIKVLLMSGYADEITRSLVMKTGFQFLSKPFTADALGHKVREALDN
jgi:CheY-like chemotaxis protein